MYFRWAAGVLGGFLLCGLILAFILFLTYSDANAGLPMLFFAGMYMAASVPVAATCAVLAGISLAKHERHRAKAIGLLLVSCLVVWTFGSRLVRVVLSQMS